MLTPPDQLFSEAATIDLGDRQLQLAYLGHGHTDNDIVIDVPDAGVLFAGDLLENDAAPSYGDAFPRARRPPSAIGCCRWCGRGGVPGHGGVGDRAFVAAQAADLAAMAEVGALLAGGALDEEEAIRRALPGADRTHRPGSRRAGAGGGG